MAAMVRLQLRFGAFREIRTSSATRAAVRGIARDIANTAGGDVVAEETEQPRNRARAAVIGFSEKDQQRIWGSIEAGRR